MLLEVRDLTVRFGGVTALSQVNLVVRKGEIVGLIGPNGAGKTTLFNVLTRFVSPTSGEVWFKGTNLRGLRPHQVNALGIARTFQNIRLFSNMTVLDNVRVGYLSRAERDPARMLLGSFLPRSPLARHEEAGLKLAWEILAVCQLSEKMGELAKNLPYGEQRRLELARALACGPDLLLLDEPTAGMDPEETEQLVGLVRKLRDQRGVTILLIEHDMRVVMGVSDRVVALDYGKKIADATPQEAQNDPLVIEAYLGRGERGAECR